jgi:hypothetical protein
MAYYYVKTLVTEIGLADGTDNGRFATQQTGSFAALTTAKFYSNITQAFAAPTPPSSGDFICVSNVHDFTQPYSLIYNGVVDELCYILSVQDSDINLTSTTTRGKETASGAPNDFVPTDVILSGLEILVGDIFQPMNSKFYNCKITLLNASNYFALLGDGNIVTLIDSELAINEVNTDIIIANGASLKWVGGSVTTISAGLEILINGSFSNGGGVLDMQGVDISVVTGVLINGVGNDENSDDLVDVKLDLCKLAAGVSFVNETFKSYNQRALFTRCSDSSAAAEYQYHLHAFGGNVDDDSAIYRNEDEPFTESNQKISYKIVTNSDASLGAPLWLDFPVLRYSQLSDLANDTLTFHLTSDEVLTDKDIYIEVIYPDSINKQKPNFLSSAPTAIGGTLDLMATGTTLTVDTTSTWTGELTNKYQIDLDTSGIAGSDCLPIVKVYITKPSITIQIASEFGLS